MKIKKDKFFRKRGGKAKITDVKCAVCNALVITYQKDGSGWLKRCYLNRIMAPPKWTDFEQRFHEPRDMKKLTCSCGSIIGTPMRHKDGRLAYHLIRGSFKRRNKK